MSKELESLKNIRADIIDYRDLIEGSSYSTDEDYEIVLEALKRNEPMKAIYTRIEDYKTGNFWDEPTCPKCKSFVIDGDKFCSECGQKLDWKEKENESVQV